MAIWYDWIYDDEFEKVFRNIGKDLWEDLRQEVILIVLEYDKDKIDELVIKGKHIFKYWVVRVCINNMSKNGYVNKIFNVLIPVDDVVKFIKKEIEVDYDECLINQIENKIKDLYWYDKEILSLYIKLGSVRKVSMQTGIPHTSIFITIKKVQSCIKQSLEY